MSMAFPFRKHILLSTTIIYVQNARKGIIPLSISLDLASQRNLINAK